MGFIDVPEIAQNEGKIYIIHENDKWIEPLKEELERRNLPYEDWNVGSGGSFSLNSKPPKGVFYNRMSPSSHSRGHRYAPEHTQALIRWLERNNARVVNGSQALQLELSKVAQYTALEEHDIQTPFTVVVTQDFQQSREKYIETLISQAQRHFGSMPFIVKHNRSGKGLGVRLFNEMQYFRKYLEGDEYDVPIDGITLLQRYIKAPEPYIIRAEFVNYKFVYAVRISTSKGFNLCPADYCSVIENFKTDFTVLPDFAHPVLAKYEEFLRANQIQVAGLEFIEDASGNLYTYDVNTCTNYNSPAEKRQYGQLKGMAELAEFLGQELRKTDEQQRLLSSPTDSLSYGERFFNAGKTLFDEVQYAFQVISVGLST